METIYWQVTYLNIEGDKKITIIKSNLNEYQTRERLLEDSEISQIYSMVETGDTDYDRNINY